MAEYASSDVTSPVQQALDRFKLAAEAEHTQRELELEDLRFVDEPEGQWDEGIRANRAGGMIGGIAISARPCLTIDKVSPPIKQVVNQAQNARLAIQINPKSGGATKETAEMLQGLYRNIEVESRAQMARMWAFKRAAKCGRGYYRILKAYANDGDFDQDILISRILNQGCVYLDPFHQLPDGSDAEWAFVVEDVPWARFRREHPKSKLAQFDADEAFESIGDQAPGWMNGDGEAKTVRIAEYFCAHYTTKTLFALQMPDGSQTAALEDEIPEGATPIPGPTGKPISRPVEVRSIKWQKINGIEVLEEQDWDGRYIPIVQVIGEEFNVNGKRSYAGLVRPAKDPQRMYNYMASAEAEAIGLAPKAPWLIAEGVIETYEGIWNQANTRNFTHLPYRLKSIGGQLAPPPTRNVVEPAIQAISISRQNSAEDIQAVTGQYDPSMGKADSASQSGKAIEALKRQSEQGNSDYLEQLATVSMTYEAKIVLDLMPYVYDRPGRIVKILTGHADTPESVMLNAPFTKGPDGQPIQAPHEAGNSQSSAQTLLYDLKEGQYSCTVSIGKAYSTKRQEANAMMAALAEAMPQFVPYFADVWVRNMDIPGGDEVADRFQKMLPEQLQESQDGQQSPEQLEAANVQLQQQVEEITAQAQQMQQAIETKQAEIDAKVQMKEAELAAKAEIEQQKLELARIKMMLEQSLAEQKLQAENIRAIMAANASMASEASRFAHESGMRDTDPALTQQPEA